MAGDEKNVGGAAIDDGMDPLSPLTGAIKEGDKALLSWLAMVGTEIVQLDASAAPVPQSQHPKLRVRAVIVNPVTAGALVLTIGTRTFTFDGAARSLQFIPFPLLIERGSDMSCNGADGRIYLIGDPE